MDTVTKLDLPMIVRDARPGGFVRANRMFTEQLGYTSEDLVDQSLLEWIHPEDRSRFSKVLDSGCGSFRGRHQSRCGGWNAFDWKVRSEEQGPVVLGVLHGPNLRTQKHGIELNRQAAPTTIAEILETMALFLEDQHPGMKCSVLLLDDAGRCVNLGAGPSLPPEYNRAIEGMVIGPGVGSCGTASYWNERIIVEDIQKDPLWRDLRGLAQQAGVGACWSHPITAKNGEVLGTAALYNSKARVPTEQELDQLEMSARMFGLAIEQGRAEQALRESEARSKQESRLLSAVTAVVTSFMNTGDWKSAGARLVRASLELTESEYGFLGEVHGDELRVLAHEGVVWSDHEGRALYTEALRSYEELGYLVFPNLDNLFGCVITSGESVISNAVSKDRRSANRLPEGHPMLRNFLGAPIKYGDKVVAMICVANKAGGYFENELRTAEFLCRAGDVVFDSHRRNERESDLEEQLHQAAKMEALGVMAGGLAHDFNNVLAIVLGNVELAMMKLPEDGEVARMLREVATASGSAAEICNQMLAYAGRGMLSTKHIEYNGLIKEFAGLLRVTLPKKAILEYSLCQDALFVDADRTQMGQVLMNLITNAAEALDNETGRICVTTATQFYDEDELKKVLPNSSLAAGAYVRLQVADTGSGMSLETQDKIFDPFFTTKFTGRGLGLAAVQGIVRRHQGGIGLESELGKGTTFTVLLPCVKAPEREVDPPQEIAHNHANKRIMVVDDEPQVRNVLSLMLESAGFEVVQASNGREAINVFEREWSSIDCVLLDLSMPDLDGEETLRALREFQRDVRAVLISGFTEQDILNRFHGAGFSGVLQKPVSKNVLIAKIHEALC